MNNCYFKDYCPFSSICENKHCKSYESKENKNAPNQKQYIEVMYRATRVAKNILELR